MDDKQELRETIVRGIRFGLRFRKIYEWAVGMRQPIPFWRDNLNGLGEQFWRDIFYEGLRHGVYEMLTEVDPPSIQELLEVGWIDGNALGVYIKIAWTENDNLPDYTYVGMATATASRDFGLNNRKKAHEREWKLNEKSNNTYFHKFTVKNRSEYELGFAALWTYSAIEDRSDIDTESTYLAKVGCNFTEFVLSKWLSSYRESCYLAPLAVIWPEVAWLGTLHSNSLKEKWMRDEGKRDHRDVLETQRRHSAGLHLEGVTEAYRAEWVKEHKRKEAARSAKTKRVRFFSKEKHEKVKHQHRQSQRKMTKDPIRSKKEKDSRAVRHQKKREAGEIKKARKRTQAEQAIASARQRERRREQALAAENGAEWVGQVRGPKQKYD